MKAVSGRNLQIIDPSSQINVLEFAGCSTSHIRRESLTPAGQVEVHSSLVCKRFDHVLNVMCHVTHVKLDFAFIFAEHSASAASRFGAMVASALS
jgi:hypothetical protein